jgi:hypothetical protein
VLQHELSQGAAMADTPPKETKPNVRPLAQRRRTPDVCTANRLLVRLASAFPQPDEFAPPGIVSETGIQFPLPTEAL